MKLGAHVGREAAQELKEAIIYATSCLSFAMEEVVRLGGSISHEICTSWTTSLQNLQNMAKDFNILISRSVGKLLLSVNKAIVLLKTVTTNAVRCWLASLKEINNLVNTLPYIGQHTGEYAFRYIGAAAIDMITTKMTSFLQHSLTRFIILQLLIYLFLVNLQLLLALTHDPYFIHTLIIALVATATYAVYLWCKRTKYAEEKQLAHHVEIDQYQNKRLQNIIQQCDSYSAIDLKQQELTDQDMPIVVKEAIINKKCKKLYLNENKITSAGVRILAEALNNKTLEILSLYGNEVCDDGVDSLVQTILNKNGIVKRLNLNKTGITDTGVECLAQMIEKNQTMTQLCLHDNKISDRGVRQLANAIENHNTTIELLRLSSNKRVTDNSVNALVQMIEHNKSLRSLYMADCSLSETGREKLREVQKLMKDFIV